MLSLLGAPAFSREAPGALVPSSSAWQPFEDRCADGRFYVYYDETLRHAEDEMRPSCIHQTFHCHPTFAERLLAHECRTRALTSETPVIVANLIWRGRLSDPARAELGKNRTLNMLSRMPPEIHGHRHLYLFEGGEHWTFKIAAYVAAMPPHAIFVTPEPDFATHRSAVYREPAVPQLHDACYLYAATPRVLGDPFWQMGSSDVAVNVMPDAARRDAVFYYGGLHGRAERLRRRLYELCDMQGAAWNCRAPEAGSSRAAQANGGLGSYFRSVASADFCLCPTGDSPGRALMWDALARGCVPVLFSSCPQSHLLQAHAHLLQPDAATGFGVRHWALLLNQTAVMTNDSYLADSLAAVTAAEKLTMRQRMAAFMRKLSFSVHERSASDAVQGSDAVNASDAARPARGDDILGTILRRVVAQQRGGAAQQVPLPEGYEPWGEQPNAFRGPDS